MVTFFSRLILWITLLIATLFSAQSGSININVYDEFSKKPLSASVRLNSNDSDFSGEGNVLIENLPAGNYSFTITSNGYEAGHLNNIDIVPNQNITYSVGLNRSSVKDIDEVVITRRTFKTTAESPVSLRNITSEEVQKNAGSNRDISKAVLSLPGVGSTATFRNDLFIRGGSSAENKF